MYSNFKLKKIKMKYDKICVCEKHSLENYSHGKKSSWVK